MNAPLFAAGTALVVLAIVIGPAILFGIAVLRSSSRGAWIAEDPSPTYSSLDRSDGLQHRKEPPGHAR